MMCRFLFLNQQDGACKISSSRLLVVQKVEKVEKMERKANAVMARCECVRL